MPILHGWSRRISRKPSTLPTYTWYDQNWKEPKEILHRLVATVCRGGTYLLNVGPDGEGRPQTSSTGRDPA